jgi:hypothetical protein
VANGIAGQDERLLAIEDQHREVVCDGVPRRDEHQADAKALGRGPLSGTTKLSVPSRNTSR